MPGDAIIAPPSEELALLERIAAAVEVAAAEGLAAVDAARVCGVSRAKFLSLDSAGGTPARVELGDGRCPRWLRSELIAWLRAGAPPRRDWARLRDAALRRAG